MTATAAPFLGLCDYCNSLRHFITARERDLWEKHHPHQEDYGHE